MVTNHIIISIIFITFILSIHCQLNNNNTIQYDLWIKWKLKYKQNYNENIDDLIQFNYWQLNVQQILLHNLQYDLGIKTYRKSINQYTAINWNEYKKRLHHQTIQLNSLIQNKNVVKTADDVIRITNVIDEELPLHFDWRDNDTVTTVKTQDNCGSSWAFAAVEALEGQLKLKTNKLIPLSAQQLIDCTGDHECVENPLPVGFDYIKHNGVESEDDYKFVGNVENCTYNASKVVITASSYSQVLPISEDELQKALYTYGPIAVTIAMTQEFLDYESGVLIPTDCQDKEAFESVLLVGYGIEDEIPYWLIKFSLGTEFGDQGYIKLARNHSNMCHIASYAYYPVI
ncbi:Cathepsin S [Schistosoma japonicum]|nr:Cathepsin S [Schistosoma japonicum]